MAEKILGYQWNSRSGVNPHVLSSADVTRNHVPLISRISHPCWVLDYSFTPGELFRVRSSRRPWEERLPRIAHLYPPGLPYWEDARAMGQPRRSAWICFLWSPAESFEKRLGRNGYARFNDPAGTLGKMICDTAGAGQRLREEGFWQAQSHLCRAIDFLLHAEEIKEGVYCQRISKSGEGATTFAQTVEKFLQAHLHEKVNLEEIAQHVHMSPSTLSHRYRREVGVSPMATFMRFRIAQARILILRGLPLKVVADHLGFSDAFHLSKAFKRLEGTSPKRFMEQHRLKGSLGNQSK